MSGELNMLFAKTSRHSYGLRPSFRCECCGRIAEYDAQIRPNLTDKHVSLDAKLSVACQSRQSASRAAGAQSIKLNLLVDYTGQPLEWQSCFWNAARRLSAVLRPRDEDERSRYS